MLLPAAQAAAAPLEPVALPAVPGSEVEPNDGLPTANPIASGERIRANLPASDVDYYSFTAVAGERVFANTVTAGSTGGSSDTVLTLLDSQEMEIEQDDNDGSQLGKASSIAGREILTSGTYYLKVSNGGAGAVAPYDLYFQLRSGIALAETDLTN